MIQLLFRQLSVSRRLSDYDTIYSDGAYIKKKGNEMKEITVKIEHIWLEPMWAVAGTRGSFGSCRLRLSFSPEWKDMQKRVTFFPADASEPVEVLAINDEVIVPAEVMSAAGSAEYVIDGKAAGGEAIVTQKGELRVVDTASPGGRVPAERTPDIIEQLRAEIAALRAEIDELKVRKIDGIKIF